MPGLLVSLLHVVSCREDSLNQTFYQTAVFGSLMEGKYYSCSWMVAYVTHVPIVYGCRWNTKWQIHFFILSLCL